MSGCVNELVCGNKWEGEEGPLPGENTCMTCGPWFKTGGFGFGKLDIDETPVECAICTETKPSVRFPQCTHRVCTGCFRDIMFRDETRHHLDPMLYGCPPCPNGCKNPPRGTQCYCEEYDAVQDQWKEDFPGEFRRWNDDEHESIGTPIDNPTLASKRCPFCRREYDRDLHGSMTGYTKQMYVFGMPHRCYVCRKPASQKCSACKVATYCSKICQKKHWRQGHNKDCASLKK